MLKKWLSVFVTLILSISALFVFPIVDTDALDIFPFVIMTTGNMRGQVQPFLNGPNKNEGGLTKVATVIDSIRTDITSKEGYTMLIDAGNSLVGSDLSNTMMRKPIAGKQHPMIALMNYLKYDASGYGISDFSMPSQIRDARKRESSFTWISTNAYLGDNLYASDHRMLVYDVPNSAHVLKIAVISLPDPSKTSSIPADSIKGMTFADPTDEIIRVSDQLKELDRADFIVLLTDMEWERNPEKVNSSFLYRLLERSRIDVCIPASDDPISGLQLIYPDNPEFPAHDVVVSSPGRYGLGLSRVELVLEKCKCPVKPYEVMKLENGARNITGKVVKIGRAIPEDVNASAILAPYISGSEKAFNEIIGSAKERFTATGGTFRPTSLSNFLLQTIQETAKSNIAILKPSEIIHNLEKGPLTYQDVYSMLATDDTIFSVTLTGTQIKELLEESAEYLSKGLYNFGINTLGLTYSMDLRQKSGSRIKDLKFAGKPIVAGNKYTTGILSSLTGGSGRLNSLSNVKIQTNTRKALRDVTVEKIRNLKTIAPTTSGNWFVVPDYLDHWANESIAFLQNKKVISGYSDGRFLPDKTITRAEFTKIATGAYGIAEVKPATPTFTDVTKKDWFFGFVEAAKTKGMIPFAVDKFFLPNKPITREEAMIELVVAVRNNPNPPEISAEDMSQFQANVKDFSMISSLALPYMIYASKEGLIKGYADGTIHPKYPITRAETSTIIFRAHYPTILLTATANVSSKLNPEFKDPMEDRPIGGLASIDSYLTDLKNKYTNFYSIDAGNYLMGSSASFLSNGEIIGNVYSKMGYKTFGLSDEDLFYGVEYLNKISTDSKIDIINADITDKTQKNLFIPGKITDFAGIKLGVTGISGFSIDQPFLHDEVNNQISVLDSVKTANENVKKLKQDGSNIQVIVTGLKGTFKNNELSANIKEFLDNLNPKPSVIIVIDKSLYGFTTVYKDIRVIAPGSYGNSLGISKIIVDSVSKNIEKIDMINQYTYADDLAPSPAILTIFKEYEDKFVTDLSKVIGKSENGLKTTTGAESQLGDLVTDVMKSSFEGAEGALITPSLIKNNLPKGDLKVSDLFSVFPKDEDLVLVELKGSDIIKAFEHGATFAYGLIQISGFKFKFDNTRFLYDRVVESTLSNGDPLVSDNVYKVVITESMRRGLDSYEGLTNKKALQYSPISLRNLLKNYIDAETKAGRSIDREVEGRIELVYNG
jgi:2',3'-cyclic-nucleotide 2'-phosphodiesterase/3'-nucleotidase